MDMVLHFVGSGELRGARLGAEDDKLVAEVGVVRSGKGLYGSQVRHD